MALDAIGLQSDLSPIKDSQLAWRLKYHQVRNVISTFWWFFTSPLSSNKGWI